MATLYTKCAQRPTAESCDVYSIRSSYGTVSRIGRRWFEPLQTARPKIQLASRLLVRCSSEPGRIVDRIGAKCRECLFFGFAMAPVRRPRARTRAAIHVGLSDDAHDCIMVRIQTDLPYASLSREDALHGELPLGSQQTDRYRQTRSYQ